MLIPTIHSSFIPAHRVIRVVEGNDGKAAIDYDTGDGTSDTARTFLSLDEVEGLMATVTPATPGYSILAYTHGGSAKVTRFPVIGWRVRTYGCEPVSVDGAHGDEPAIECPDGHVIEALGEHWPDIGAYVRDIDARAKKAA